MKVVLVDKNDRKIGEEHKMKAHKKGALHRAFSVLVFDSRSRLILQKRARGKYHCGCMWSNTCCSHPLPGERVKSAAERRLKEEMGFTTSLSKIFSFTYKHKTGDLIEHEFDHVFVGFYHGKIEPDKKEVEDIRFIGLKKLEEDIKKNPEKYTPWLKIIIEKGNPFFKDIGLYSSTDRASVSGTEDRGSNPRGDTLL